MIAKLWRKLAFREPLVEDNICGVEPESVPWSKTVDSLVVGFGGAGAAAAIESFNQGLETLVLDRFNGGGATTISGGIYYAGGGTATQLKAGVEDTPENMFRYLHQEVQGAVSDETLRDFCEQSVDNYNWMVKHGVPFDASFCPFKTSYPPDQYYFYYSGNESYPPYSDHAKPAARGHRGHGKGASGAMLFQPLKRAALAMGLPIQTQTKVTSLISDKNGRVIGVKTLRMTHGFSKQLHSLLHKSHNLLRYAALYWPSVFPMFAALSEKLETRYGRTEYIKARHGVVLATGGFYSNQAMVQQHAPAFVGGSALGTMSDDGSGIKMAMGLGAKTDLMENVSAWRFINPPLSFVKGVLVGTSGQRVCNEMLYGAQVGDQIMSHHEGKAWVIIDKKIHDLSYKDLTLKKSVWFQMMLGYVFLLVGKKKANSIEELALKIGVNPKTLSTTIADYNLNSKGDDLDPQGKPKEFCQALEQGPFYAINASYDFFPVPCTSLTLGGLKVNEKSGQVITGDGNDIPGLYAAGRVAVGIPSKGYVSGLSIADCIYSGRRAARAIALSTKREKDVVA